MASTSTAEMEATSAVDERQSPRIEQDARVQIEEPAAWTRQWDEASGSYYFVDARTGECSWEVPIGFMAATDCDTEGSVAEATDEVRASPLSEESIESCAAATWVSQFDPTSSRVYYYNTVTGESHWDQPDGFTEGTRDGKMDGAVKIQSIFRSKKARDRVKNMNPTPLSINRSDPPTSRVWRQHFDPRTQVYYYHNLSTGEVMWEKPSGHDDVFAESDRQGGAATKIQSVFRKNVASKAVETKKQAVRDLTGAAVIEQKLKDLMHAVDEIQGALDARNESLSATTAHSHLVESVSTWQVSASRIRDRVLDHYHHAALVQQIESKGAEKLTTAQKFHDELASTRSECLALLRNILQLDSYFVDVDVTRVNDAFQQLKTCMQSDVFEITECKVRKVLRVDELDTLAGLVSKALRKATGLTDFTTEKTSSQGKNFGSWHPEVQAVINSMARLEQAIAHKRSLLAVYRQSLIEKQEATEMEREDQLTSKYERALRKAASDRESYAAFLELCRQKWRQGLVKRVEDEQGAQEAKQLQEESKREEKERLERIHQADQERRNRVKLSIWEAVRAGHSVDIIRTMVFAEMQKARQNGYDFVVRTACSNRGESLVQIACWAGHAELVQYFLDEGADVHAVDSYYNQFTLLHDAARRGHGEIIRLLISRGLQQNTVDRAGDTPLHWAVRSNHYEAVLTLLGAHIHRPDPKHVECAQRAVRAKNHRGRTPIQLAKSECMRRLLQAFEEGRIRVPAFRRANNGGSSPTASHGHRRMTESAGGAATVSRSGSFRSRDDHKHLAKASTVKLLHPSPLNLEKDVDTHSLVFDEFGVSNVGR